MPSSSTWRTGSSTCTSPGPASSTVRRHRSATLEALVASKLHLIPRYRQRVRTVPFELGRPVWVDDPHFDLGYHLRHTALPAPGDDAAFCRLMGRIMSQPLDRERPLWEAWLVEGLEGGRGRSSSRSITAWSTGSPAWAPQRLLDFDADAVIGEPRPWAPRPEPPGALKVLDAWGGLVSDLLAHAPGRPRIGRPSDRHHALHRLDRPGSGPVRPAPRPDPAALDRGPDRPPPGLGPLLGQPRRCEDHPLARLAGP